MSNNKHPAEPRLRVGVERAPDGELLHVQGPAWGTRGIPGAENDWGTIMDKYQGQSEEMPSFGMAPEPPINHWGAASRRVLLPAMDPYPAKRWTPQKLQLDLHLATLSAEDQQSVQAAVQSAWPQ